MTPPSRRKAFSCSSTQTRELDRNTSHRWTVNPPHSQCHGSASPLAAFQVSTYGRFWVSTEGFRLFFRFSSSHKAIVYAWVNDETTLRKAGAQRDPYAIFTKRLKEGNPPDDWDSLVKHATSLVSRES